MNSSKMMWIGILILLLVPSLAFAQLTISAPDTLVQDMIEQVTLQYIGQPFDGTALLTYNNLQSSTSFIQLQSAQFNGNEFSHIWHVTPQQAGSYSVHARLINASGFVIATFNKSGLVNSSEPTIAEYGPSGIINTRQPTLIVATNQDATCRFGTSNHSYSSLATEFENTDGKFHNHSLSGLSEGQHTYYVRCQDVFGFVMEDSLQIKFNVDLEPTAQIKFSDESPIKAGTIEIEVLTSEPLDEIPILEYSFNDAPDSRRSISLTGKETKWRGYLIVTESDDNKVGTIYFRAVDNEGNVGTRITNDNLFLVDTTKPVQPQSVKAITTSDGFVHVDWYYDGEPVDHFNVYRTIDAGVELVDFYAESENDQYRDTLTYDKVTYYYRVSAIDEAGNEGPLSDEVFATSLSNIAPNVTTVQEVVEPVVENPTPQVLPPNLVPVVEAELKLVESALIDVDVVREQLDAKSDNSVEFIQELDVAGQIASAKQQLEALKAKLEGFKEVFMTQEELEREIQQADIDLKKIEKNTPVDVSVLESAEFIQSTTDEQVKEAVLTAFTNLGLTEDELNKYVKSNNKVKDKIRVEGKVSALSIEYMDGSTLQKSFISKKLSYEDPSTLSDVVVVETIPSSIANTLSDITFHTQGYETVNDHVLKFGFLEFDFNGEEIKYSVDRKVTASQAKDSSSVVLLSLNTLEQEKSSVTGLSIITLDSVGLSLTQSLLVWIGLATLLFLTTYYFIFVKDSNFIPSFRGNNGYLSRADLDYSFFSDKKEEQEPGSLSDLKPLPPLPKNSAITQKNENNSYQNITKLINKAYDHLADNEHHKAVKLYPTIEFTYQNLSASHKKEVIGRCVDLHTKLHQK